MASVEERRSKTKGEPSSWRVYWRLGGRGGPKQSTTWSSRKRAEAANMLATSRNHNITAAEVYRAIAGATDQSAADVPTLAQWAQTWLADRRRIGDIQPDTIGQYEWVIGRHILQRFGHLPLTLITRETVGDWVAWLRTQPSRRSSGLLGTRSVRYAHMVLHSLLAAAVGRHIAANPAAKEEGTGRRNKALPQLIDVREPIFLTPQEMFIIITNCRPAIRDIVYVALRTGLRLGELLVLRAEDVSLTGRKVIRVRRALKKGGAVGPPKSRRSRRDVTISDEVAEVLDRLIKARRRDDLIFTSPTGRRWVPSNLRYQHWVPTLAAAMRCPEHLPPLPPRLGKGPRRGWRASEISTCDCPTRLHRTPRLHDLRHTHASILIEDGWGVTRVSRRLGHESVKTTIDIYGHLWPGGDDDRLRSMEQLLKIASDDEA